MTEAVEIFLQLVADRLGLVVPALHRDRLDRALAGARRLLGPADTAALGNLPLGDPAWQAVIDELTVNETRFNRDPEWFAQLQQHAIVPLIAARRARGDRRLRFWSAGCATGEEAYTLAILLDKLLPDRELWDVRIMATDISQSILDAAAQGHYRSWALRDLSPEDQQRYFSRPRLGLQSLDARIRRQVTLRPLNLALDGYPDAAREIAGFDLVLCRNVLIYFTDAAQRAAAARLRRSLAPGGWLATAPAEATADWFRPLVPVNLPGAILFRNDGRPASGPMTAVPRRPPARLPPVQSLPRTPAPAAAPATRRQQLAAARGLADRGALTEARRLCEALLAADTLDGEANLLLATICEEAEDLPAALEAARRASYLAPHSAAAHFRLGCVLRRVGRPAQSRRSLQAAVRLLGPAGADDAEAGLERLLEIASAGLAAQDGGAT